MKLDKTPMEETQRRALYQTERLVNARPLTELPVDPDEEEWQTPNQFPMGSSSGQKAEAELEPNDLSTTWSEWETSTKRFWERGSTNIYPPSQLGRSGERKLCHLRSTTSGSFVTTTIGVVVYER